MLIFFTKKLFQKKNGFVGCFFQLVYSLSMYEITLCNWTSNALSENLKTHICQDHTSLEFIKWNQVWYLVFCHLTPFKTIFWLLKSLVWQSLLQDSLQVVDLFQYISIRLQPHLICCRIMRCFSCSNIKTLKFFFLKWKEGFIFCHGQLKA